MLRNSPDAVLMMLATVKCGAIAGMLNYHQRGDVLAHSIGLLNAKLLVGRDRPRRADHRQRRRHPGAGDHRGARAAWPTSAPTANPGDRVAVLAKDKAFYIFTSGTTGIPRPA